MKRDLAALHSSVFDLLVVGGGVLGACVARDAALRGLRVALIDAGDFGAAASANSLKIVHGGLRYLQHLDLRRMRASIRERSTWLRIAPHLVEPLPVVAPAWRTGRHRLTLLQAALAVNDLVGLDRNRGLAADRSLPRGRRLSRDECLRLVPELEAPELTGAVLFHDAQMYSGERLTLAVVDGASAAGAVIANHVECDAPLLRAGELAGVLATDRLTGERFAIAAARVVNAAGGAADDVAARLLGRPPRRRTALSAAVNLQLAHLGHRVAFSMPGGGSGATDRRGGRQLFVTPWRDASIIGTGHFPLDPAAAVADELDAAAAAFLDEVNRAWPGVPFRMDDVTVVHRGLLPVARAGSVRLLKRHRIIDHRRDGVPNLLTAIGVKFTTARLAAEDVVDRAFRARGAAPPPCRTATTPLPAAPTTSLAALLDDARAHPRRPADDDVLLHLVRSYGERWLDIVTLHTDVPGWSERLVPALPVIGAQIAHGVRHELACSVDDLLLRRTEIGARGHASQAARAAVARILHLLETEREHGSPPAAAVPDARGLPA